MSEHDRDKGSKEPILVYSEITGNIYIAYKHELIDVTESAKQFVKMNEKQEHDKKNAKTYNKDYPCYLDYPLKEEQEHE